MSEQDKSVQDAAIEALYSEAEHYKLNTGEETIHAKRIPGLWRNIKWITASVWLIFFLGPYLRWGDRQAVLFDIPNRQFHIFGITILPQDFWMLSLVLLFFAILLAVVTALAGRVYCGFFCFQTVWTDIFTMIEDWLEGAPQKRRKLDQASWDFTKVRLRATKYLLWLVISVLTGVSFVAWFVDAFSLWGSIFTLTLSSTALFTILLFTAGTFGLAGFLREQTCLWLCPYARIQGVMVDLTTSVPTYDFHRGEPRGRATKKSDPEKVTGDCVDCLQCVAVCPTGVDIRHGQQEGCIMCALCIDACDSVMVKLNRPTGLIRYESLDKLNGKEDRPILKRPRVWVYGGILTAALSGIAYGLSTLDAVEIKVLHERQPLFVIQSDGSVQNKYTVKVLNKMNEDMEVDLSVTGIEGMTVVGAEEPVPAIHGGVTARTMFVRIPAENVKQESTQVTFHAVTKDSTGKVFKSNRDSIFIGPG